VGSGAASDAQPASTTTRSAFLMVRKLSLGRRDLTDAEAGHVAFHDLTPDVRD